MTFKPLSFFFFALCSSICFVFVSQILCHMLCYSTFIHKSIMKKGYVILFAFDVYFFWKGNLYCPSLVFVFELPVSMNEWLIKWCLGVVILHTFQPFPPHLFINIELRRCLQFYLFWNICNHWLLCRKWFSRKYVISS